MCSSGYLERSRVLLEGLKNSQNALRFKVKVLVVTENFEKSIRIGAL